MCESEYGEEDFEGRKADDGSAKWLLDVLSETNLLIIDAWTWEHSGCRMGALSVDIVGQGAFIYM